MPIKRIAKSAAAAETPAAPAKGKKVTVVAPPAEAKAEAKAATPKEPKATRNISRDMFPGLDGVKHHMRIAEFQDYTLSINGKAKKTDKELCALWQEQFPKAVTFTEHHVRGVRRDYNAGRHSKQYPGKKTGDAVSIPYGGTVKAETAKTEAPAKVKAVASKKAAAA